MNEQYVNLVVNTVFVFLYSFFKPVSWSKETKERVSISLAVVIGVALAVSSWDKDPWGSLELIGVAVAYSQALYRGLLEKLGVEGAIRRVRVLITPPSPPPQAPEEPAKSR